MDLIFTQFPTISFLYIIFNSSFTSLQSQAASPTLLFPLSLSNQKRVPRTLLLLFTSISSLLSFSNSVLPFQCPNQPNPFSSSLSFSFISSLFHFNKHMGNCLYNPSNKTIAEIVPHDQHLHKHHQQPDVRLYGSPSIFHTLYLRFALLHKGLNVRFIASESESDPIVIEVGSERVSGTRESLLQYIEARFPQTPLVMGPAGVRSEDDTTLLGVKVTVLQHKSVVRHLERLVRWAEDLATRGGKRRGGAVDPTAGSPRMELRKFGKSYSQLRELMLEHAQMEEKVLFPILNSSDPEICKAANQEHARDLPIMNGIKEDIKSIGVLDNGSPSFQEALWSLSKRLKLLQQHCKEHFVEEEKELLPYMEATELSKVQQQKLLEQSFDVMRGTHSHLFSFFLEGLLPLEAMQYLDLFSLCYSEERIASRIRMIFPE